MGKLQRIILLVLLCPFQFLWAQQQVTGKVTDKGGLPVFGATVTVKNSDLFTVTDENGNFSLSAPLKSTLVISHVSFGTSEVSVTSASMNIRLEESNSSLSEVVVVGYGTKIKRDVTSSISKISNRDFQNLPLPSYEQALQ